MLYLLALITIAWLVLPFIPALVELKRPRDVQPLSIASRYRFDRRNTAEVVASEVYSFLQTLVAFPDRVLSKENPGMDVSGRFRLIGDEDDFHAAAASSPEVCNIVISREIVDCRTPAVIKGPVYVGTSFHGAPASVYESVFGENDVYLGPGSRIRNSLYAKGFIVADKESALFGSIRSECQILVRDGCSFERLDAPSIVFGRSVRRNRSSNAHRPTGPEAAPIIRGDRSYVEGNFVLSRNAIYEGNLVVHGRLLIGRGAHIRGNVKCRHDLTVEDDVMVVGHVFCGGDATVGRSVELRGVVNVEGRLNVSTGTRVGSWNCSASLVAETLIIEEGVHVTGTVWALRNGVVVIEGASTHRRAA